MGVAERFIANARKIFEAGQGVSLRIADQGKIFGDNNRGYSAGFAFWFFAEELNGDLYTDSQAFYWNLIWPKRRAKPRIFYKAFFYPDGSGPYFLGLLPFGTHIPGFITLVDTQPIDK